jgi:hypothetical protein
VRRLCQHAAVRELRPGLWHWQAAHPDRSPEEQGITAERAGDGSPDLGRLRAGGGEAHWYAAGDRLPFGIEAFAGDTLADFGDGIGIQSDWLRGGVTREEVAERLRPLLELPVELLLPAHGAPTDRASLERALSWSEAT